MGTVYLVENTALEREEALKVPHFGDGDDPQLRERFLREARSAAKLDHANLCPIYAAGVQDGIYYLTMRFLRGKLLSDYIGKPQPVRKSVEIVTKLAQALEAAHAEGVIHRDLKPSNVIMVAGVGPVVMDFGLAKQVRQLDQKLTQMGAMLGTPAYMPPEQVNGDLERMGPPSDVYSLGVILYELLTGRLPFEGSTAAIFGQILSTEPPLPSTLVPGLNPAPDGICRKAMAKVTTERYPSMKAFAAALMDYLRSMPATDGAGNLVPPAVDRAAILPAPTAVPGLLAEVKADIFQAATVAPGPQAAATVPPQVRSPVPPTQTAGKAPSALRKADGAGQPAQTKSTAALKWFALAAVAGSALLCLGLSTVLLVWLASRAGVNPANNDAIANGKTNKEQVGANDNANSETPDSKPAEPAPVDDPEVKKDEVKYDMDQFEKAFGLKLKTVKRQPRKAEGDTLITMTLEFTKDLPSAIKGGFPPIGGIPYKSLEGLRTVLDGGMIREGLQGPGKVKGGMVREGLQLRCYLFDDEGVPFTKQAPGKIDGAVSGVKGDSFRISQSVPNDLLAKTKKISYRAEPFREEPFKK